MSFCPKKLYLIVIFRVFLWQGKNPQRTMARIFIVSVNNKDALFFYVGKTMTGGIAFLSETRSDCELSACAMTLNIGRQRLSDSEYESLLKKARDLKLLAKQREMVDGAFVNTSEKRQALHTSLRSPNPASPHYAEVEQTRERMYTLAEAIRSGQWLGATGEKITDVINVGIGGSEMGPHAVYHALRSVNPSIRLHFLSAVDGVLADRILGTLNPHTTVTVVSSKSFSTRETMLNAELVNRWYQQAGIEGKAMRGQHIFVVSAKDSACEEMNLPEQNRYPIWSWVGGRFSVWGAIGLPLVIALGSEVFKAFLKGANAMDRHMLEAKEEVNLPLTLALLSYWNSTHLQMGSHCLLAYDERLRLIVAWLQQLEMESLGKSMKVNGSVAVTRTGLPVWGGFGNEAQHSFYQWLRDGSSRTSIDLVWCEKPGHDHAHHHLVLNANAQAQAQALVTRQTASEEFFNAVTTIRIRELTAETLGAFMAMYEHKTTMLAALYGLNAFDQPAVEYGKRLCRELESQLAQ